MTRLEFTVTFEEQEDGPEPELLERLAFVAGYRLGQLADQGHPYPVAGGGFDLMDAFEGPYVWEMTDEEFEATPPTVVDLEVVSVDPAEPADGGPVQVVARVFF